MTSLSRSATRAEAGFVLVAVLWILAALATLASIYSSYTVNTAAASRVADDRVQAEASIRAGVEMAAFRQLALPEPARPARGGFDMRVGRIVGWRTKAQAGADANAAGADGKDDKAAKEDKLYSEQHMPYPPRHAPFDNALELSLLPGVSLAVVERVLPFVTVFSGHPEVDVSSADPTVLSAFPEMTPQILGAVLNARVNDPGDGRALLALLGPAKARATADRSKAFRASIAVEFDNGRHVHAEVVFRLKDKADEPYELLYWRDDFDGPMQSA
jgi:general secretion pathway protein K